MRVLRLVDAQHVCDLALGASYHTMERYINIVSNETKVVIALCKRDGSSQLHKTIVETEAGRRHRNRKNKIVWYNHIGFEFKYAGRLHIGACEYGNNLLNTQPEEKKDSPSSKKT
jgi:hypothetical protein